MDFRLSEEQRACRETAKKFATERMAPNAAQWDIEEIMPVDILREAAQFGFAGLYIGEDVGGSNLSRVDGSIIFETLAQACPSTSAFLSIHNMSSWGIDNYATNEQRKRWLPSLCSMDKIASYCLTEPDSGSDASSLKTNAVRDGNEYVVNGSKAFISGADVSDVYLCMVRTGGPGASGISCLIVERETPGLSFGPPEAKLGWHSQTTSMMYFENCRIPVDNLIGQEGDGFKIAMRALDGGRLNIGSCSLGAAQHCFDKAISYMRERVQFGKKLKEFEALRFKMADMATELEAARLMLRYAAFKLDAHAPDSASASAMAKRFATDIGFNIVNGALQMHGGYGYLRSFSLERFLRDVRVHQILEGTNEIMRLIIARDILDMDRFVFGDISR